MKSVEKKISNVSLIVTLVIISLAVFFVLAFRPKVTVIFEEDNFLTKTFMLSEKINYNDILEVNLIDSISGQTKVNGFDSRLMNSGKFKNDEYGTFVLIMNNDIKKLIVVKHNETYLIFNLKDIDKTLEVYNTLLDKLGE